MSPCAVDYLDAESSVPIKDEVKRTVRGAERWFAVELGDYRVSP